MLALLDVLVLVGGTVHTMTPGEAPRVADVRIENGRIAAVGPRALDGVPADAARFDASGMHVLPGLVDGMVHHDPDHDLLYVASGVTLVRDVGGSLAASLVERTDEARARGPGPALSIAGAVLDGVPPATTESIVLDAPLEVRDKLPRLFELGVDFVSLAPGLPRELWPAVCETAHEHGRAVWGPKLRELSFAELCEGDQDGLFHLDALLPVGKSWDQVTFEELEPALERLVASGMAVTPTLAVLAERLLPPGEDPPELRLLSPFYARDWQDEFEARRERAARDPEGYLRAGLAVVALQGRVLAELDARGVTLVPGSASPHPWLFPGRALVSELGLWTRAGLAPERVLSLATEGAARALGQELLRGTLAVGRIADVIVVDADPRQGLDVLARPAAVVVRGRLLDRDELARRRAELEARVREVARRATEPIDVPAPELPEGEILLAGKVETRGGGQRLSAERFAVVRQPDGRLAFCGRMRTPGSIATPDTELAITQEIAGGRLEAFRLRIASGPRTMSLRGRRDGDAFLLERRGGGGTAAQEVRLEGAFAYLDAGSITAELVLGHVGAPGFVDLLFLDNGEPVFGRVELRLDRDGSHLVRGARGDSIVRFAPDGVARQVLRRQGSVVVETRAVASETFGGPGLPLAAEKRPAPGAVPPLFDERLDPATARPVDAASDAPPRRDATDDEEGEAGTGSSDDMGAGGDGDDGAGGGG